MKPDPEMDETLLTVLALSQEGYRGPMTRAVPKRLASTLSRARRLGLVDRDADGLYLTDAGAAYIELKFWRSAVVCVENPVLTVDTDNWAGLSRGHSPDEYDPVQLEIGTRVEFEHTHDPHLAQRIAMDHLTENVNYYYQLAQLEAGGLGPTKPS